MTLSTQPYKGARDFYPDDKRVQNYIFSIWREVVQSFGYEEYDAPIIEPLDIYLAKTSEEIVNEQTYVFKDRGHRQVTLRPEMTPTVSRMVAGRRQEIAYPARWYSIPNLWRYERPQRGRLREHWQLNVDLFGIDNLAGDHELIMIADAIMQRFGAKCDMYTIKINSRQLVNYILHDYCGLNEDESIKVIHLIDHMQKLDKSEFKKALKEVIGTKTKQLLDILQTYSLINLNHDVRTHEAAERLHNLEMMLARCGIINAQFDITLMRGFDYYTDIVFEVYDNNPENKRSLFGGGRYDGLVAQFGVEPVATVGFGMGDVTIKDFLEVHKLLPVLSTNIDLDVVLIGEVYLQAQELIKQLRDAGIKVAVDSTNRKMDKIIKSAVKTGYRYALFIGQDDLSEGKFNLKELSTGVEQKLSIDQIIETISNARV